MILPIYTFGTKVLREKSKKVVKVDDKIMLLIKNMFETMKASQGIGIAANQVGVAKKIFLVDISEMEEYKHITPMVFLNPEIIFETGSWEMEEGCLSIPNIRANVLRSEKIKIKFQDINLEYNEIEANEFLARVILHEFDHINGVLYIDKVSNEIKRNIKSELKKIEKGDFKCSYKTFTKKEEVKKK